MVRVRAGGIAAAAATLMLLAGCAGTQDNAAGTQSAGASRHHFEGYDCSTLTNQQRIRNATQRWGCIDIPDPSDND